jgi:hypothetical protein
MVIPPRARVVRDMPPRYANGRTYVGGWKTREKESGGFVRLPHGEGTFTWPSGSKYVGQYKDGRKHGQGTLIAADGHKYVGRWTNGRPHGDGTTTTVDGEKHIGEYKDGKLFDGVVYGASGEIKGTYSGGEYIPKDAPKPVSLTVSSHPSFAEIYIDSIYQGNTELSVELSPGTYSVNVKKDGYIEWQRTIQLNKDMDILASLAKKEKPKPKPEPSTKLVSTGTGFVINKSYIVTAEHVVDDCNNVTIRHSHKNYHTEVVARDVSNDLGLLRLEKLSLVQPN